MNRFRRCSLASRRCSSCLRMRHGVALRDPGGSAFVHCCHGRRRPARIDLGGDDGADQREPTRPSRRSPPSVSCSRRRTRHSSTSTARAGCIPGLARSWTTDASKTRVTLRLRDGAHFWNGDPSAPATSSRRGERRPQRRRTRVRSLGASPMQRRSSMTIRSSCRSPTPSGSCSPAPSLAVYRPRPRSAWPLGSGPYRITESAADVAPGGLALVSQARASNTATCDPVVARRARRDRRRRRPAPRRRSGDGELRVDAIRTSTTIPLPWSRAIRARRSESHTRRRDGHAVDAAIPPPRSARRWPATRFAPRRAPPSQPIGGPSIQGCQSSRRASHAAGRSQRQRSRASSIAATTTSPASSPRVSLPLGGGPPRRRSRPPTSRARCAPAAELAYVVDLPRASLAPCHDLASLLSSAPWLSDNGAVNGALIPLIDTRERAIVKRASRLGDDRLGRHDANERRAAWGTPP